MPKPKNPKPNDQTFKRLVDADPRGLLEFFGAIRPDEDVIVTPLEKEIVLPSPAIDSGLLIEHTHRPDVRRVVLLEALSNADAGIPDRVGWYATFLAAKFRAPVYPYIVPLVKRACPVDPPRHVIIRHGRVWVRIGLTWWKPWEKDPASLLARHSPALDVWTVLCRATPEQEAEAIRRLAGDGELLARQRIWAGMRYRDDKEAFHAFLERRSRVLTRESDRESLAVQEWLAEGMEKGRVEGIEEGRAEGRIESLREVATAILAKRFPRLSAAPLRHLTTSDLEQVIDQLLDARTAAGANKILARKPAKKK